MFNLSPSHLVDFTYPYDEGPSIDHANLDIYPTLRLLRSDVKKQMGPEYNSPEGVMIWLVLTVDLDELGHSPVS